MRAADLGIALLIGLALAGASAAVVAVLSVPPTEALDDPRSPMVTGGGGDPSGSAFDRDSGHVDEVPANAPGAMRDAPAEPMAERKRVDPTHGWRAARERLLVPAWWERASAADRREIAAVVEAVAPGFEYRDVRSFESGGVKRANAVFLHRRSGQEFVLLAGGTFQMGSPVDEAGRVSHESQHEVTIGPFLIARTELTQAAWRRVFDIDPSRWEGDDLPVEFVKWQQAKTYCERVGLSLPTEAQWEYASRGGTDTPWSFGDDVRAVGDHAWFSDNSGGRTHRVAQKRPNAYGLHDMHGNVWEWCLDWHAVLPFDPQVDPHGPESGSAWVIKGGSFWDAAYGTRSANRLAWSAPQQNVGFRPVRNLD